MLYFIAIGSEQNCIDAVLVIRK